MHDEPISHACLRAPAWLMRKTHRQAELVNTEPGIAPEHMEANRRCCAGESAVPEPMRSPAHIRVESPGVAPASLKRKRSVPLTPRRLADANGLSHSTGSPTLANGGDAGAHCLPCRCHVLAFSGIMTLAYRRLALVLPWCGQRTYSA